MARTVEEIKSKILVNIASNPVLSALTNTSVTAIYSLLAYIVAVAINLHEQIVDGVFAEIKQYIAAMKPHTTRWYATMGKNFMFGYSLPVDTDKYDTTGLTDEEIEAAKIVKYIAVIEGNRSLLIKIAKDVAGEITVFNTLEQEAFTEYIKRIKDAGIQIDIRSEEPDDIKLKYKIYYDPLILDFEGKRLDFTNDTPCLETLKNYLKNLPFNGLFVIEHLTDALQKTEGVVVPSVVNVYSKYALLDWQLIEAPYLPYAGYMRVSDVANIEFEYLPLSPIA